MLTNSVFNVCEKIAVVIFSLCQVNGSLILASCVESHSTSCYSPFILFCASLVYLLPLRYRESLPTLYMTTELWNKLYANNLYPECKRIVVARTCKEVWSYTLSWWNSESKEILCSRMRSIFSFSLHYFNIRIHCKTRWWLELGGYQTKGRNAALNPHSLHA